MIVLCINSKIEGCRLRQQQDSILQQRLGVQDCEAKDEQQQNMFLIFLFKSNIKRFFFFFGNGFGPKFSPKHAKEKENLTFSMN